MRIIGWLRHDYGVCFQNIFVPSDEYLFVFLPQYLFTGLPDLDKTPCDWLKLHDDFKYHNS